MTFGGSGNDSINGAAMDPSGNIYVVGTTSSFDLPQLNPYQAANSGTQLVLSANSGAIWTPVSSPFPNLSPLQPISIAADPTNSSKLYLGFGSDVCSSTDGGHHFQCVSLPIASSQTTISSLAIDPHQPSIVYASASLNGGVFKSIDGGQTWSNASQGLPSNGFINSVTLDPFHENILYAWAGSGGYVSQDAGATWTMSTLPWPTTTSVGSNSIHFTFDPVVPGIIYGPGYVGAALVTQKSMDGGQTWTQLATPFTNVCCVVPDPKTSGVLYAFVQSAVWKSVDGGNTWNSTSVPSAASGPLTISACALTLTQIANAFSLLGGAVAPGEILALTVPSFNPAQALNIGINVVAPLTANLGGVQVFFDGVAAYVMSVVPGQIVCIAPLGIAGQQSTAIRVSVNGALSNVLNAPVSATALGLLSADNSGTGLANARNADGTLNTAENPAQAGSNITVYFTGAGVTSPAEMDGVVPTTSNIAPAATITGFGSGLGSVHALAGFVPGIFSYTVSLPANLGKQQLGITLNSTSSQSQNLYIYVN